MSRGKNGNPKAAVEAWLIATGQSHRLKQMQVEGLKQKHKGKMFGSAPLHVEESASVPRGTSVSESETSEQAQEPVQAPLLCFPLSAFIHNDPGLPPDFQSVERTGQGLKQHLRPDGAVFLGLFEIPKEPHTGIVVFGPPNTSVGIANQCSQQYRDEQHALESGFAAGQEQTPLPTLEPKPSLVS